MKFKKRFEISKLILTFLSFVLMVTILIVDGTFAWFTNRYVSPYTPTIEGADFTLDVNFIDQGDTVYLSDGLPVTDFEGLQYDGYEFTIENIGNVAIKVNIKVEVALDDGPYAQNPNLINFRAGELRNALILKEYVYVDPVNPSIISYVPPEDRWVPTHPNYCPMESETFDCIIKTYVPDVYEFDIAPGEKFDFVLKFWIDSTVKNLKDKLFYGRIVIESSQTDAIIVSASGANSPTLLRGMIPVVFDEATKTWKVISEWDNGWYNYNHKPVLDNEDNVISMARQWANVVTVREVFLGKYMFCPDLGGCNVIPASVGLSIPDSEITSMFVWIPRFRYTVKSSVMYQNESAIDITWEHGTSDRHVGSGRYSGRVATDFYTASAFIYGDRELEGFWISKFELGNGPNYLISKAGSEVNQTVSDDSWNDRIVNSFQTNGEIHYGLVYESRDRVHQIKNSQWDAVAFLSQSRYGKFGADSLPIMPNNYLEAAINIQHNTQHTLNVPGRLLGGNDNPVSTTSVATIKSYSAEIKSGYVCTKEDINSCSGYNLTANDYIQSPPTIDHPNPPIFGSAQHHTYTENTTNDQLNTSYVYYDDPLLGGNGSTTGNIYGVYDIAMGREEVTNSIFVSTGNYHTGANANLKTFAIPGDLANSTMYVAENGTLGNFNADEERSYTIFYYIDGSVERPATQAPDQNHLIRVSTVVELQFEAASVVGGE